MSRQRERLVYLSALAPDSGESASDLLLRLAVSMDGMKPDGEGFIWLDDQVAYRQVMATDVEEEKVHVLAATQQPIAAAAFDGNISRAAWREKPCWVRRETGKA